MSTRTPSTVRLLITVQKTGLGAVSSHRSYSPLPVSFSFFFLSSPHSSHSFLQVDPLARFRSIADATPTKPRVLITGSLGQLGRGLNTVYKYMYGDVVTMTDIVKVPADATDVCKSAFFLPHVGEVIHHHHHLLLLSSSISLPVTPPISRHPSSTKCIICGVSFDICDDGEKSKKNIFTEIWWNFIVCSLVPIPGCAEPGSNGRSDSQQSVCQSTPLHANECIAGSTHSFTSQHCFLQWASRMCPWRFRSIAEESKMYSKWLSKRLSRELVVWTHSTVKLEEFVDD